MVATSLSSVRQSPISLEMAPAPREAWPCLTLTLLIGAIMLGGILLGPFKFDGTDLDYVFGVLGFIWVAGIAFRRLNLRALGAAAQLFALFVLLAVLTAQASAVLAAIDRPYADTMLAAADVRFFPGFSWSGVMTAMGAHDGLLLLLSHIYASLNWQPPLLLCLLPFAGRERSAWLFLTAWAIALVVCLVIFPFFPAVGAYAHFGINHADMPGVRVTSTWHYPHVLAALRDGHIRTLGTATLEGIVTMPSFHACGAVLLGWGYGQLRPLRWPFLLLNAAMLVSAVPIGGHYLIDVAAGVAVALLAIAAAKYIHRRLDAPARKPMSHEAGIGYVQAPHFARSAHDRRPPSRQQPLAAHPLAARGAWAALRSPPLSP